MNYIKMFQEPDGPILYMGYLPQIEVMPTKKDKEIYNYIKKNIPRDEDRKYILKLLADNYVNTNKQKYSSIDYEPDGDYYNTIGKINNKLPVKDLSGLYSVEYVDTEEQAKNIYNQFQGKNISSKIINLPDGSYAILPMGLWTPDVDENISNNDVVKRLAEIHNVSGNPKISKTPYLPYELINKLTKGKVYSDVGTPGDRAHMQFSYVPWLHKLYNITSLENYIAEISHSYGDSTFEDLGRYINGVNDQSAYEKPYSMEHTTHSHIEPLISDYILKGNISLPEINKIVTNKVADEKKKYQEQDMVQKLLKKIKSIIK